MPRPADSRAYRMFQPRDDRIEDMPLPTYRAYFREWLEETDSDPDTRCEGFAREEFEDWLEGRLEEEDAAGAEDKAFEDAWEKEEGIF